MAVCQDPGGAFFCVMQQREHQGAELVNELGCWTWNNLMTRDTDKAKDFYGSAFGWEAIHNEEAPPDVLMWQVEGQHWTEVYLLVPDIDAEIKGTKGAGGTLLFGPEEIPVGKLAVFTDPQGAAFALMEPDYPEPR